MMKKLATLLLAVVLVTAMAIPAFAVEFTPSAEAKAAPVVVTQTGSDGKQYAGIIYDANGKELAGIPAGSLTITPVSNTGAASAEVKKNLDNAYQQLKSASSLTSLSSQLTSAVKEYSPSMTVDDLVVRDMFDVTLTADAAKLLKDGASISIRFALSADAKLLAAILHNVGGTTWETIPSSHITRNSNDTVDVQFTSLSPIAFLFDGAKLGVASKAPLSPQTGMPDNSAVVWFVAGSVAFLATTACVMRKRRSSQKV